MYLKSLEIHGFKSFANKTIFDFHNGITGVVGPNGSGKSNVADAVRWVLGEQSTKQLRGASMQDVIFAGTENRKALSYAYVAIVLDNSDHQLAIDFEEVTIARRLYRSGESEYLINGSVCRLKEVTELFYDTGIGKEGYSIIGQGQIDRILSGKPEERRELFDEAAGIVKYKKRKDTAQKKLENERENLVRVNDILSELERQVEPLAKQSEKAKIYLNKKTELKEYDINLFLLEMQRIGQEEKEVKANYEIVHADMKETTVSYEKIKKEYEVLQTSIQDMDEKINSIRENVSQASVTKEKLESSIQVLNEQIRTAEMTDEHLQSRLTAIETEKKQRLEEAEAYHKRKSMLEDLMVGMEAKKDTAQAELKQIQKQIAVCNAKIEDGKNELIQILNHNAVIKAEQQRCKTMLEQIQIRKAELNKRLLDRKTQEESLASTLEAYETEFAKIDKELTIAREKETQLLKKTLEWKQKEREHTQKIDETQIEFHKQQSRLESLKNIAERYDGYGNSIRKVMEQKKENAGILGVVSDLIQVEKKYEIAIETALGGNIQNIVTEDEETAKQMIAFLKKNRYGRATFLPLTSVTAKENPKNEVARKEEGVLGVANQLVQCEEKYKEVAAYLLGRVLVVDTIDHAIVIAKKYHYSLHMVTLEGEYFSTGGSISGGAFKNSSNLLARNREIEELEQNITTISKELAKMQTRKGDIETALVLNEEELASVKATIQEQLVAHKAAQMNVELARRQKLESDTAFSSLSDENKQMDAQAEKLHAEKQQIIEQEETAKRRKAEIEAENEELLVVLEEKSRFEETAKQKAADITMEENGMLQNLAFQEENLKRIQSEIERFEAEKVELIENVALAKTNVKSKQEEIEQIRLTITTATQSVTDLQEELTQSLAKKEEMSKEHHGFFQKQEDISKHKNNLDREIMRLTNQLEKLEEYRTYQTNYMWNEYEITPHRALEFQKAEYDNASDLKKKIAGIKDEIRKLGDVNVNAIEEYKEISQRYQFLKGQHDDLLEAEKTLLSIISDLDTGMRKQFQEKFAQIQVEFNKSFKQLFGGGHATLELVENEDILESGIRIIAQPPGKKLQNMMQLSGGEKALTAIALLFAIQVLKPSPFCLLDEIEAALDDSNVTRFAQYLNRLTEHTQFIVITHRKGTMAEADRLYGITMQEKGVSTLVSVNLIEHDLSE